MTKVAASVLRDPNLFESIAQYQCGLPKELLEVLDIAQHVKINPMFKSSGYGPSAYLSNIPDRFMKTCYLEPYHSEKWLRNYILFLYSRTSEPALPLHLSIVENNVKHVELWIKYKPEWLSPAPLMLASTCGHFEIVKRLILASKAVWTAEAMNLAAMNGYFDIVQWIHSLDKAPRQSTNTISDQSLKVHFSHQAAPTTQETGLSSLPCCSTAAMDGAARNGHLEIVRFLNENRSEGCTGNALIEASRNGYAKVVDYLLTHRQERVTVHGRASSEYLLIRHRQASEDKDYLGVLQCLHRHSINFLENFVCTAILAEPLPITQYIHEHQLHPITKSIIESLVQAGDKEAIQYALEIILNDNNKPISLLDSDPTDPAQVKPWTPRSSAGVSWNACSFMDMAARLGNLDAIQLLHRSGIQCCSSSAMDQASAKGRLDILEWLHNHRTEGCTSHAMTFAATRGHLHVVKWLHQVRGLDGTSAGLASAAYHGDAAMVQYLLSIPIAYDHNGSSGISWYAPDIEVFGGNAVDRAASSGHINIVEMLHEFEETTGAMDCAAQNGHFDMVQYLHTHRKAGCTTNALMSAISFNRFDLLKYLVLNDCAHGATDYSALCSRAITLGNLEMLSFLMDHWATDIPAESQERMMSTAVNCGHLHVIKWLHEVKKFELTHAARESAQRQHHTNILEYFDAIDNPMQSVQHDTES